ncbi:hypothetical protein M422DRAFT_239485 [Sphaerobolus stellatus SS14]|nr:hypothetical protein M422DRAFT_239485 [Sphaerobolus stellatus SS14]
MLSGLTLNNEGYTTRAPNRAIVPARAPWDDFLRLTKLVAAPVDQIYYEKQRVQPTFSVGRRPGQSDLPHECLQVVPNSPANPTPSRAYYPFEQLQRQFDKWEQEHSREVALGAKTGNLIMLQDGTPGFGLPYALRYVMITVINGTPERKLTLRELRVTVIRRFERFARSKDDPRGWKWNLNQCSTFQRIPRQHTADDPGSWWTLTSNDPPDLAPYKYTDKAMGRGQRHAKDTCDTENTP